MSLARLQSAGSEATRLFTTFLPDFASHLPLLKLLEEHGYDSENRGEQTWCLAVKRSASRWTATPGSSTSPNRCRLMQPSFFQKYLQAYPRIEGWFFLRCRLFRSRPTAN